MMAPGDYLSQLNSSVIRLGLGPLKELLVSLQNPQEAYASVIIGGTNGKGSIAATISSILAESGYRVGLYTSPHLVDVRERIRVNGAMLTQETLDALIEEVRGCVQEAVTYFEFLTAVAFLYYYRMQIDVAVLEVGLGGRLDATNVATPLVSVISNISLEHQEYLGNRLTDIAREKGGIIKDGVPCVTAATQPSVRMVLGEICREKAAPLYQLGKDMRVRQRTDGTFSYYGIRRNYDRLRSPLTGRHQIENAALALAAVEILAEQGFPATDRAVHEGVEKTIWEGRLEVLQANPQLIVDGGHNVAGISVLCRALLRDFSFRRLILVFAVMKDKNYTRMLKKISPLADKIIVTTPGTERAVPAEELRKIAREYNTSVEIVEPTIQAVKRALAVADKEDLICVTGSLYLVGEVKKGLGEIQQSTCV